MASWICLAVHPPAVVPPCSRISMSRIMRVSWILMPGNFAVPTVIGSARRCKSGNTDHVAEKVDHLFRTRQPAQISVDDYAVESVVYRNQQAGKQLCEEFHRSSVFRSCLDNLIFGQTTGGIKISNMFG